MVEKGFELSEASHAPVMMELRIRACHVTGEFATKSNKRAAFSGRNRIPGPPRFEYNRLAHPPALFVQLAHATRAGLDVRLRLAPGADGAYRAELAPLAPGRWQIVIEDPRGSWRLAREAS